jgi:hypothetical protein
MFTIAGAVVASTMWCVALFIPNNITGLIVKSIMLLVYFIILLTIISVEWEV